MLKSRRLMRNISVGLIVGLTSTTYTYAETSNPKTTQDNTSINSEQWVSSLERRLTKIERQNAALATETLSVNSLFSLRRDECLIIKND